MILNTLWKQAWLNISHYFIKEGKCGLNWAYLILTSTEKQTLHKHIVSINKGEKPFKISIMKYQICIEIAFENTFSQNSWEKEALWMCLLQYQL